MADGLEDKITQMHETMLVMKIQTIPQVEKMADDIANLNEKVLDPENGIIAKAKTSHLRIKSLEDNQSKKDKMVTTAVTTGIGAFVLWVWALVTGKGGS